MAKASIPGSASRILDSGLLATIEPDRFIDGAYTLTVGGTPQSNVNLSDPTHLSFEYVQRMGAVIDRIGMPGQPLTALHLGAGGLTIPRYIAATRPGSRQQVLELERGLVDLVREHLPWDARASIRIRYGDARELLGRLPAGLAGTVDLAIVDIFGGSRIPAHVTTLEFYRQVAEQLAPGGLVLVNIADGPTLAFARGQAATLQAALGEVTVLGEQQVLKGRRFGNVVLVGSVEPLPAQWMPRIMAAGPHPGMALQGDQVFEFSATAPVVTDATAQPSPPPSQSIFQFRSAASRE